MKIIFKGKHFKIVFRYIPSAFSSFGMRETRAYAVLDLFPQSLDDAYVYAEGWARCSPKDKFTKERGRKIALARMFEDWSFAINNEYPNKKQREIFWRWYLNYPEYRYGNCILDLDAYV